jgi:hypothetical protein
MKSITDFSRFLKTTLEADSTAAIIVSRRCFICLQLSILHPSCRRVCGGGRRFRFVSV